ncbi:MAG: sensor histidine kinase N-terminal domain-containing protein [Phycisphaerales bacterium]|nr:sensor histidine kinase N-terminal domain-containing protein [Phycisphaerales bacterium]
MTSIRARLLVPLLVGPLIVLALGGVGVYWVASSRLSEQLDAALSAHVRTLAGLVTIEGGRVVCEFSEQGEHSRPGVPYVVLDPSGGVVAESPQLRGFAWRPRPGPAGAVAIETVTLPSGAAARAAGVLFAPAREDETSERLSEPPPGTGAYAVIVAESLDGVRHAEAALAGALTLVGLLTMATLAATVWLGVRVGLAPLRQLGMAIRGIAVDNSGPASGRERATAPRELAPVYDELDHMVGRVEGAIARERRFTDAASHELRTPLAELRTVLDVAARWPDPERLLAAVLEARGIGIEMERLVEALLLHHAPSGEGVGVSVGPVALAEIERLGGEAASRGVHVEATTESQGVWRVAPAAAQVIIRNLIGNAVEYSPRGGHVRVFVRAEGEGGAGLVVENGPVALEQGELPRLFEPFWRRDAARADRSHHGLGLSIVRHVTSIAGLCCEAELVEGATLRMTVRPSPSAADRDGAAGSGSKL